MRQEAEDIMTWREEELSGGVFPWANLDASCIPLTSPLDVSGRSDVVT